MATLPLNLTLIREDHRRPRSLSEIKTSMTQAPTDYVMVVGLGDIVDIPGALAGDIHYLTAHVATRRQLRHTRPTVAHDPLLLTQYNYMGSPILHRSLIPLFPEAAREPWHTLLVRAQTQGASFSLIPGDHTIVDSWPRPVLSGAYAEYRRPFDPEAVMEAVPGLLVQEIGQQPFYTFRKPRAETVRAFCRGCEPAFLASLADRGVTVQEVPAFDLAQIRASTETYVAWFDGIADGAGKNILTQLRVGLEFESVTVVSPRVVAEFTPGSYQCPAFEVMGIRRGFSPVAWMSRTEDLLDTPPSTGCVNSQVILREIL